MWLLPLANGTMNLCHFIVGFPGLHCYYTCVYIVCALCALPRVYSSIGSLSYVSDRVAYKTYISTCNYIAPRPCTEQCNFQLRLSWIYSIKSFQHVPLRYIHVCLCKNNKVYSPASILLLHVQQMVKPTHYINKYTLRLNIIYE